MKKLIKRIHDYLFGKIFRKYIRDQVSAEMIRQLPSYLLARYPQDQLFYDVANFIVYNQIRGDYLEFGVRDGQGLARMYAYLQHHWTDYIKHAEHYGTTYDTRFINQMRFFAFDSFAGLPGSKASDTPAHFTKPGIFAASIEDFYGTITSQGVDQEQLVVIPGWFDQTLTQECRREHRIEKSSIIFIDCDLYESATIVFDFITETIQNGTILIIDDFFRYKGDFRKGIQKAFRNWVDAFPHIRTRELSRCGGNRIAFVCHIDDDTCSG